jgi:hypothetical protein
MKEMFCGKRDVGVERLRMSDIKETLSEMGYESQEGSVSSILVFESGNAIYQIGYEDFRLDVRMYVFSEDLSKFNIFKAASERVDRELAMIKSAIKLRDDGSYFVLFACNAFLESRKEFKKFFPWYLRETKDAYAWFKKYSQELYENLRYSAYEENECNSSESSEFVS